MSRSRHFGRVRSTFLGSLPIRMDATYTPVTVHISFSRSNTMEENDIETVTHSISCVLSNRQVSRRLRFKCSSDLGCSSFDSVTDPLTLHTTYSLNILPLKCITVKECRIKSEANIIRYCFGRRSLVPCWPAKRNRTCYESVSSHDRGRRLVAVTNLLINVVEKS